MITKKDVCEQVLATIPEGQKITLEDAVTKADSIKHLKNKNMKGTWKFHLALYGVVTKDETGTHVAPKPAVTTQ
jgi:hypothetical protein